MSLPPAIPNNLHYLAMDYRCSQIPQVTHENWLELEAAVIQYGRQCWNAAIDAALDVYFDEDTWAGEQDNTDVAIRNLKITANTVSTPE
jgi:hypothetical protein